MPVEVAIRKFADRGVSATYVVPTETGLKKSILDAHEGIRGFFKTHDIHDYTAQQQGPDHKVVVPVTLVNVASVTTTTMSLYRPVTKSGDPRLWIKGLGHYATAWNLLAFIVDASGALFLVNCSNQSVLQTMADSRSPLGQLVLRKPINEVADELRVKLEAIQQRGFIQSLGTGPMSVGFTLEALLGIAPNSKRTPDYKGIELKSSRRQSKTAQGSNLSTIFTKAPDKKRSALDSKTMLATFGYRKGGRLQLYCTVGPRPNPQGLYSLVTNQYDDYEIHGKQSGGGYSGPVHTWDTATLEARLRAKHPETFWIDAVRQRDPAGLEQFHYIRATHTQQPLVGNLCALLEIGKVTLDYTMSEKPSGAVRDHGYEFRIKPKDRGLLFPSPVVYTL